MREITKDTHEKDSQFNIAEYWRILWRKKYFVLVPLFLAAVVAIVGVRFVSPVYMSSSLIRMEDESYLTQEVADLVPKQERRQVLDEDTLAKIQAEIESTKFLSRLIDKLGVGQNPELIAAARADRETRFPDLTIEELVRRHLTGVLAEKIEITLAGPGMFRISCYDYSPSTSYLLANAVTNLFIDSQSEKRMRGLQQASDFSDEQLAVYKRRLEESEAELERLQNRITELTLQTNPVGGAGVEYGREFAGESNLRYAESLKEQLDVKVSDLQEMAARLRGRLREFVGEVPSDKAIERDSEFSRNKNTLTAYRETQLRLELVARGIPTEDLKRSNAEVEKAEDLVHRRLVPLVDSVYGELSPEYRSLIVEYYLELALLESYEAKRSRLDSYISAFKTKLDLTPQLENQLTKLREEVKTNRELYNSFLRAKTSTQISEALQQANLAVTIEVLERASRPLYPVKPDKKTIFLLALMFGGSLGVGGLVIGEVTDRSFRTIEEVEAKLGVRVLGTVPDVQSGSTWSKTRARKQAVVWMVTSVIVLVSTILGFYYYGKTAARQTVRVEMHQPRDG